MSWKIFERFSKVELLQVRQIFVASMMHWVDGTRTTILSRAIRAAFNPDLFEIFGNMLIMSIETNIAPTGS